MWIWQQADWPNFIWDEKVIDPKLRDVRFHQGMLLGKMSSQPKDQKKSMLDTLLANIIHSSAIEGEKLNAFSVRSSLAISSVFLKKNHFQPLNALMALQK